MGNVRIVAGRLRRARIPIAKGAEAKSLRPTSEKARAAIFDIIGGDVEDAHVVDAFAGSGALGLEALSRGAASVTFIERDRRFAAHLKDVLGTLNVERACKVLAQDAVRALALVEGAHLVFVDPPYARPLDDKLLAGLEACLAPRALVVVERDKKDALEVAFSDALSLVDTRVYGGSSFRFFEKGDT